MSYTRGGHDRRYMVGEMDSYVFLRSNPDGTTEVESYDYPFHERGGAVELAELIGRLTYRATGDDEFTKYLVSCVASHMGKGHYLRENTSPTMAMDMSGDEAKPIFIIEFNTDDFPEDESDE